MRKPFFHSSIFSFHFEQGEIIDSLSRNKARTFLTAFGIFWGVFMLMLLMGGGQGLQQSLGKIFAGFASNAGFIFTDKRTVRWISKWTLMDNKTGGCRTPSQKHSRDRRCGTGYHSWFIYCHLWRQEIVGNGEKLHS